MQQLTLRLIGHLMTSNGYATLLLLSSPHHIDRLCLIIVASNRSLVDAALLHAVDDHAIWFLCDAIQGHFLGVHLFQQVKERIRCIMIDDDFLARYFEE
jgi:hypothetical protein